MKEKSNKKLDKKGISLLFDISLVTVDRWIKSGILKESVTKLDNGRYLFDKELAIKEHNANKSSKMILQGGDNINSDKQNVAPVPLGIDEDEPLNDEDLGDSEEDLQELSLVQLEKKAKIKDLLIKAKDLQLKTIKVQEAEGLLINKEEANAALYNVASALKMHLLAIPSKCIDEIRATDNRSHALELLTKQIEKVLINIEDELLNEL
jgi:phage terminase Nu1 subunit (DNA packaging protein)